MSDTDRLVAQVVRALDCAHPITGEDHDSIDPAEDALFALAARVVTAEAQRDALAKAARACLVYAIDTPEGQKLRDTLAGVSPANGRLGRIPEPPSIYALADLLGAWLETGYAPENATTDTLRVRTRAALAEVPTPEEQP